MKKIAFATAALALFATPAFTQYAEPYSGGSYMRQAPSYGYGPIYSYVPEASYGFNAPYGEFYGPVYSRERDIATEPDPNIRLELRREQNLNEGIYPQ